MLLVFSICTSLQKQAPACCKYVQVLCKLLTDGGVDRKHNAKTESGMYVNFSLTNKNNLKWILMCEHWEERHEKPCKHFYSVKEQWELATSWMRQSTLRAQGEDSYALVTAEM